TMGAIILLFVIGFEFNFTDILNPRYLVIALVGVIVPWIGGYAAALLFGLPTPEAVFVGTALTATSIAITANVLRELGRLKTPAALAIIGAAVIDDVLSLLALSISTEFVEGSVSAAALALVILKAVLFLGIGGYAGVKYLRPLLERLDDRPIVRKYPEFLFIFAMMVAFFYAMCAELVGLSGIVGAFIAGISLSGIQLRYGRNIQEGAEYLHIIFASIFFVSLGIIADIHALTPELGLFLVAITLVAIATKVIGCGIPAKFMGMSRNDSLIVGFGMSPRGEVAMIVALIGLTAGIIEQGIYVTIVLMSLLTTIVTPIVFRNWLFREAGTGQGE
ncbi:MAG TPA: cation:proton antiporter, partial [Methanomicrobiales archaeon]|nr:cation:proton antiporter [Methanomicrobiales archaeon]